MLSSEVLALFGLTINYAYAIFAVPYYWDHEIRRLVCTTSRVRLFLCAASYVVLVALSLSILERLVLCVTNTYPYDPMLMILFAVAVLGLWIPAVGAWAFLFQYKRTVRFANRFLQYVIRTGDVYKIRESAETHAPKAASNRRSDRGFADSLNSLLKVLLQSVLAVGATHPILTACFSLHLFLPSSNLQIYLTSYLPFLEPSSALVCIMVLVLVLFMYYVWAITIVGVGLSALSVFPVLFILGEIHPLNTDSPHTDGRIRTVKTSFMNYRCLQLLQEEINGLMQYTFPPFVVLILAFTIICNISVLLFFRVLHVGAAVLASAAAVTTVFQSAIYFKQGQIYSGSKDWARAWKKCYAHNVHKDFESYVWAKSDRHVVAKLVDSCRPFAFDVGRWGHISKMMSLKIIGKILFYTMKIMLMVEKVISH